MIFTCKQDFDETLKRFEAFWEGKMADRPPVSIAFLKENPAPARPKKKYESIKDRWLDLDERVEAEAWGVENTDYLYDSLPIVWPNLGPNVFSAWCGCETEYSNTTSWTKPLIIDWEKDFDKAALNTEGEEFKRTVEFTRKLINRGSGKFIVGLTDLHPGGDHLAALRGSEALAQDLVDCPEFVKAALKRGQSEYFRAYDIFYEMLSEADMPATSWTPAVGKGKYYIPSNDFSCMVSKRMYEEFFLPGIVEECRFLDRSIYHLDGPGALRHLDLLLEIKELNAVQWVCGYGNEGFERWKDVYKRIQNAGKGVQLECRVTELDRVFETLRPEGVWFSGIQGITDRAHADYVVNRIKNWK